MNEEFIKEFISQAIHRIDENTQNWQPACRNSKKVKFGNDPTNIQTVLVTLFFIYAEISAQYAISSLGNSKDVRERDKEFSADGGYSGSELLKKLTDTIEQAKGNHSKHQRSRTFTQKKSAGYTHSGIRHHHSCHRTLFLSHWPDHFLDQAVKG